MELIINLSLNMNIIFDLFIMDFFFVFQNEKKLINDNGILYFVFYRVWIIVGFFYFIFKNQVISVFFRKWKIYKMFFKILYYG